MEILQLNDEPKQEPKQFQLQYTTLYEVPEALSSQKGFNQMWNMWLYHNEEQSRVRTTIQQSIDLYTLLKCNDPIKAIEIAISYNSKQIKEFYGNETDRRFNKQSIGNKQQTWDQFDSLTGGFK